jgi:2-C-methyl-D-erythritol 4-phosphate cytidylyltransferase
MINDRAPRITAIITAAGSSSRMKCATKKEYCVLPRCFDDDGLPLTVLGGAARALAGCGRVSGLVITTPEGGERDAAAALPRGLCDVLPVVFTAGGQSRRASVYNALRAVASVGNASVGTANADYVLIHDGARPWVDGALIDRVIEAAMLHGAAIPALTAVESPKLLGEAGFIERHLRRESVVFAQTPQGFAFLPLLEAHQQAEAAAADGLEFTDDAQVWGFAYPDRPIAVVNGDEANRKITFARDLAV